MNIGGAVSVLKAVVGVLNGLPNSLGLLPEVEQAILDLLGHASKQAKDHHENHRSVGNNDGK